LGLVVIMRPWLQNRPLVFGARRRRNFDPLAVEGVHDPEPDLVLNPAAVGDIGKEEAYFEFERSGPEIRKLHEGLRILQYGGLRPRDLQQDFLNASHIGAIGNADPDIDAPKLVAMRP